LELHEIEAAIEAILFASGDPVSILRLSQVLTVEKDLIEECAQSIADRLNFERRGIRLVRMEDRLQLCSAGEYADVVRLALETRKQPHLSQTAMEVLSIIAYFQPVTRAYVEQIRGVDSGYTVSVLLERGLIEQAGRMDAPGRPVLYKTTDVFLRTFGIESLNELPTLPEDVENPELETELQLKIDEKM